MMDLFETTEINSMKLANRFIRSATWEGMAADDGAATPGLIKIMTDLAEGGVGLAKSPRKELSEGDIQGIVEAFAKASRRAKEAGFDGVQIHAAHGYLLSQFLSPIYNHRTDAYGGDIQNRSEVLMMILKAIRESVGPDYPVLIKMNCGDFQDNGLVLDDAIQVGKMLAGAGIDAIELSGGLLTGGKLSPSRMGIHSMEKEAYFQREAVAFRKSVHVPLILVGGNRSYETAQQIVENGIADYISLCRPFIREPDLINRWRSGDIAKSACLSDNKCFGPIMAGKGLYCVMDRKDKVGSSPKR